MKFFDRLAKGLLIPANPHLSVMLGLLTMSWGVWIFNPFWSVFNHAEVYEKAASFAPEWAWGTWSIVCGLVIILSWAFSNVKWLVWSLCFATWHWFTVSGMLFWGDWHNTAGLTYGFVGMYSAVLYLNIKTNYLHSGFE